MVNQGVANGTKRHRKNRGMPPPATFDIDTLPGSSNLTALEAAAVIRRTPRSVSLSGAPGPQTESRWGFEIDAVQFKIRLDVGLGWLDWRSWTRLDHGTTP